MGLHLSYVAARERQSGRLFWLAEYAYPHAGGAIALVGAVAERVRAGTPEGAELRAQYSDVLVVIDNLVRESYTFADPALEARAAAALDLARAQTVLDDARLAEQRAKNAAADVRALAAARQAAEAALAAADARAAELDPPAPAPTPAPAPVMPPAPSPAAALAALSAKELGKVAATYGIDAAPLDRPALEAAILAAAPPA